MYIQHLAMSRFRCFEHAEVSFRTPTDSAADPALLPNVTLLVGGNGAGKSSILKGVALAMLAPSLQDSGFRPRHLVRRDARTSEDEQSASVQASVVYHWQDFGEQKPNELARPAEVGLEVVRFQDVERLHWGRQESRLQGIVVKEATAKGPAGQTPAELQDRLTRALFTTSSAACFLVAYGATRRVEASDRFDSSAREKSRSVRYQRAASLFEDHVALTPLAAWLDRLDNPGREKQVHTLLNKLLPEGCRFTGQREGSDYLFDLHGARLPFDALSDGYRAYIGWVADMLYHVTFGCPPGVKLDDYRGVILVDEIDLHLHPAWQRVVIGQLSKALPKMQLVLTSHSPIVAGSVEPANVRLLRLSPRGAVEIERSGAPLFGLNATQVLESPYFGLPSTRAPEAVASLRRLAFAARDGGPDAGLSFLKGLAGDPGSLSQSAESLAMPSASKRGVRPVKKGAPRRGKAR